MKRALLVGLSLVASQCAGWRGRYSDEGAGRKAVMAPGWDWNGFYIGAHAGYSWDGLG